MYNAIRTQMISYKMHNIRWKFYFYVFINNSHGILVKRIHSLAKKMKVAGKLIYYEEKQLTAV